MHKTSDASRHIEIYDECFSHVALVFCLDYYAEMLSCNQLITAPIIHYFNGKRAVTHVYFGKFQTFIYKHCLVELELRPL